MKILLKTANFLSENKINWALGASYVLYFNGSNIVPNDIDLFVCEKNFDEVKEYLMNYGEEVFKEDKNDIYNTQKFTTVKIGDVEIDLISNLYIYHNDGEYKYIFCEKSIDKKIEIENTIVNIMSLEDWYILYQLIPGREEKVKMIYNMIRSKNNIRMDLFERALKLELPNSIRISVNELIKSKLT